MMRFVAPLLVALLVSACTVPPGGAQPNGSTSLTVYSAREEALVGPIIEQFAQASGLDVRVKYGTNAELINAIKEEGANSPADVFFATDPFQLAGIAENLAELPASITERVPSALRSPDRTWVSITARNRVVAYNTTALQPADLPQSIEGYTDPKWKGRIGWAPTNGSFQAFLTAFRSIKGEQAARTWVEGIQANQPKTYSNNTGVVEAVSRKEVEVGFVNHYYLFRFLAEQGDEFPVRNYHFTNGDIGGLMLANGAAVLKTSKNEDAAQRFIAFLLSPVAQQYFASKTYEYPLIDGIATSRLLPPITSFTLIQVDQLKLTDSAGTVRLLRETGVLP